MSELLLTTSLLQPAKLYPNKPALICGELGHRLLERPVSESRRLRHGDESLRMGRAPLEGDHVDLYEAAG